MIDIDVSLIVQFVAFIVLMFVLNGVLFQPVMRVLEERKKRTEGAVAAAIATEADVTKGHKDYELKLKEAAIKAQEERNAVRIAASKVEAELLDKAKKAAQEEILRQRVELASNKDAAVKTLKDETKSFSKSIAEKLLDRNIASAVIAFLLLSTPAVALAGGGGGGEAHVDTSIYWKVFNFILLAILVIYCYFKFGKPALEKRSEDIRRMIEDADKRKAEAEAKLREYNEKIAGLDAKVSSIRENIRLEAEAEKKRMLKDAEEAAEKIKKLAKSAAEQEMNRARLEIRKEISNLAVDMARDILGKEIKDEDRERLTKNYIDKLRLN
ncbi:MAG: hypothetical protein OEV59_05775 [Deltaproteobacteria bacterium]|nr:hypothetical protein [Deltaproteobacteria bacterium]